MAAVDRGFRVVLPTDALCSAKDSTHEALLLLFRERFSQQVLTTSTEEVLEAWR
jgi:nicotinamidase-related amidase